MSELLNRDSSIKAIKCIIADLNKAKSDVISLINDSDDLSNVDTEEIIERIENLTTTISSDLHKLKDTPLEYTFNIDRFRLEYESIMSIAYLNAIEKMPIWRNWQFDQQEVITFGYKAGSFKESIVSKGSQNKVNYYHTPPPDIIWTLFPITQKGITFYIGAAPVEEIEQTSSVPSLPETLTSIETGHRILNNSSESMKEWQRRPDRKRILSIRRFIEDRGNLITNAPMIYIHDKRSTSIIGNKLIINFSRFLKKSNNLFCDQFFERHDSEGNEIYIDFRPLWLIDGQHRVRGLSRSKEGSKMIIPIIVFPPDFSSTQTAKIFSEINTLQEPLKPLHSLYMRYKFNIPSPQAKKDFSKWQHNLEDYKDARANCLSYQLAALMASRADSALQNRIQLLEQNQPRFSVVKADQWVLFSRNWFLNTGPYANYNRYSEGQMDMIYEEVNAYFQAFIATCNHNEWPQRIPRWSINTFNKGLIQRHTHFSVLINLYPIVYNQCKIKFATNENTLIDQTAFKEVLKVFKWVDWINNDLFTVYGGGGESGRSNLLVWMEDAISYSGAIEATEDQVMNREIRSVPGQGILAPPANTTIEFVNRDKNNNIQSSNKIVLISSRPFNSRHKSLWYAYDDQGTNHLPEGKNIRAENNFATFELNYEDWMKNSEIITIRVEWFNAANESAFGEIQIENPFLK